MEPSAARFPIMLGAALLLSPLAFALPTESRGLSHNSLEPISLWDFVDNKFATKGFSGTWVSSSAYRYLDPTSGDVKIRDLSKPGEPDNVLVLHEVLNSYKNGVAHSFSKDLSLVAISYDTNKVYRHSTTSRFAIYDIAAGKGYPVGGGAQLQTLSWAGARSILWVKDNDVYFRKDAATDGHNDVRITSTGKPGEVFNGVPDWVYEEEVLASGSAMWPSEDGQYVAFASFDDKKVNKSFYFKYGTPGSIENQYPELVNISYPKAGSPNPIVHLMVVDLTQDFTSGVKINDLSAPEEVTDEHILYGCTWFGHRVMASWTNRVQNVYVISSCNPKTGNCLKALSQSSTKGWVEVPPLTVHSGVERVATILPKDDRPRLAVVSWALAGQQEADKIFLTSGNSTVLSVLGWDAKSGFLYYSATTEDDPAQRHVYRVTTSPGGRSNEVDRTPECLTCSMTSPEGNKCTFGSATFSKELQFAALSCAGPDPTFVSIYEMQDSGEPRFVEEHNTNSAVRRKLAAFLRPDIVYLWAPLIDGFRARVQLLLPPGADKSGKTKYPMLVHVYGGPNSNQVSSVFRITFGDYLATSRGVIFAFIDARGSGNNGLKLMHAVYMHLGTAEITDQIHVTKYLQDTLPYVDRKRTAIWGWSYGGFATAHTMSQDVSGVFCCGVSVAPVTSFIYYDTIYTERYMGLPSPQDNESGYNDTDVTRKVDNFRHKKYLLIHGNADDNVHYQQSMELTRALEEADIMFQQQSYPDEAHALAGVKKHVYHTMDEFWTRAFHLPPAAYENAS